MDGLSAFVNDVKFTGQRRMTLNVKLSTATRKRKRAVLSLRTTYCYLVLLPTTATINNKNH